MPKDNIERAIKKGTGELEGVSYEEANYEGYGPGGVAVLVECLTDKKNRTVADLKYLFDRHGGKLGEPGSVSWIFEKKGLIVFNKSGINEDTLFEAALESGAEDVRDNGDELEVITDPAGFETVKTALEKQGFTYSMAENSMIPKDTVPLEGKKAEQMIRLMEALEDNDDVNKVYANFDISDADIEAAN